MSVPTAIRSIMFTWFPLIIRPRPAGLPLEIRVAELEALARSTPEHDRHDRASHAAEILNKAALIASDCGLADLAHSLCLQQQDLFEQAKPLPVWCAKLALQPVLNIARLRIREADSEGAYTLLDALFTAARRRTSLLVDGHRIDLSKVTRAPDDHQVVCSLIWAALLADGTRALALAGRWREAADHAARRRGVGQRLLDGRQAAILAHLHEDRADLATNMIESSSIIEPWEHAVQGLLRVLCTADAGERDQARPAMLRTINTLLEQPDTTTAVARVRAGIICLDLAGPNETPDVLKLRAAVLHTASRDAYAARDALNHPDLRPVIATEQCEELAALLDPSGLDTGRIPPDLSTRVMTAVSQAEGLMAAALGDER